MSDVCQRVEIVASIAPLVRSAITRSAVQNLLLGQRYSLSVFHKVLALKSEQTKDDEGSFIQITMLTRLPSATPALNQKVIILRRLT